jgi:hypothetical protein
MTIIIHYRIIYYTLKIGIWQVVIWKIEKFPIARLFTCVGFCGKISVVSSVNARVAAILV